MSDDSASAKNQRTLWTNEEWLRAVARAPAIEHSTASREAEAQSRIGTVLKSRYRLDRILGIGGMATVYAATHRNGHEVAIKILHQALSVNRDICDRFSREGYVANRVDHPGVVRVLDDDVADDGCTFLVMDLLDGESLQARFMRLQRLTVWEVLTIARSLLDVLIAAHAKGIVHRDLKPDNLFMTRDGHLKVLDFGVARALFSTSAWATDSGRILGTPAFMAPEQARGLAAEIDAQTDIWACGATLFVLLTGRFVHEGPAPEDIVRLAATTPAPSIADAAPNLPPSVVAIIDRALKFAKNERWESASEMRQAVTDALTKVELEDGHRGNLAVIANVPTLPSAAPPSKPVDSTKPVSIEHRKSESPRPLRSSMRPKKLHAYAAAGAVAAVLAVIAVRQRPTITKLARSWSGAKSATEMPMVRFSGGPALMGRSELEAKEECAVLGSFCRKDVIEREHPEHGLTLSPFLLDAHEVTNEEFARWLRMIPTEENYLTIRNPSTHKVLIDLSSASCQIGFLNGSFYVKEGHEREPVVEVSWEAAKMYCESKNKQLPTEAQWEFAARGPASANRRFPWGNTPPRCDGVAYGRGKDDKGEPLQCGSGRGPEEVGTSSQDVTPEGVFDLAGNVSEWVEDAYLGPRYADCGACLDPVTRPAPNAEATARVFRGSSYSTFAFLFASSRGKFDPNETSGSIGIRCAAVAK